MLVSCNYYYYLEVFESLDVYITPELLGFRQLVGHHSV